MVLNGNKKDWSSEMLARLYTMKLRRLHSQKYNVNMTKRGSYLNRDVNMIWNLTGEKIVHNLAGRYWDDFNFIARDKN